MQRDASSGGTIGDRLLLPLAALLILASHAWGVSLLLPRLPPADVVSRSPSSDVLLGGLPLPDGAERLHELSRHLPDTPGVVVAYAPVDAIASAYMVIAMRVWPRPVSLVSCRPTPMLEQFRVPHAMPPPTWRLDLRPGTPQPMVARPTRDTDPVTLCAEDAP